MGTLSLVATPIGNLSDITARAVQVLRTAELIAAEDTRVTRKLLSALDIHTPIISYHEHSTQKVLQQLIERLRAGAHVAYVSDAGTPGISDPGAYLVTQVRELAPETVIVPVAGVSALTAALSVCGFRAEPFTFFGFPPHKKGRKSFFEQVAATEHVVVLFESVHRITKTLHELLAVVSPDRPACLCREITKLHETIHWGTLASVTEAVEKGTVRGEFVLVLGPT